jgi:hypothetical protein
MVPNLCIIMGGNVSLWPIKVLFGRVFVGCFGMPGFPSPVRDWRAAGNGLRLPHPYPLPEGEGELGKLGQG